MTTVLSTRSLDKKQKSKLEEAGIAVESFDVLSIKILETPVPSGFSRYIFTSKNGVKGYLRNRKPETSCQDSITCYCVGEKTKSFLEENGLFVAYMFENAADLGNFIVNQGEIGPFLIFTGNRNRPEIVENFKDNNIAYTEVMVYETHLNPRTFEKQFQCVLFFSPSGVQSFVQANSTSDALALCIGETTADEARKHFTRVLVAERPTAQAVLDKLLKIYPTFTNS